MNVDNIRLVQDKISAHPERFDMESLGDPVQLRDATCGTAGCIAGWAAALAGWTPPNEEVPEWPHADHFPKITENHLSIVQCAADFLGIAPEPLQFNTLFFGSSQPINNDVVNELFFIESQFVALTMVSANDAIAALDALIETGKPAWPEYYPDEED